MSVDVAAIRKAPVGRVATLSADLFNGPDPVPGIEVELPLEQVKASTIGADVALVPSADLAALCDEVDAWRAFVAYLVEVQGQCRYDHHGLCQEHWLHDRPCPIERARAALATKDAEGRG